MKKAFREVAAVIGLLSAMALPNAWAQDKQPASELMAAVKQRMESTCSMGRAQQSSAGTDHEKKLASSVVKMNCECLPAEIDKVAAEFSKPDAEFTRAEFMAKIAGPINFCAGKMFRADVIETCGAQTEATLGVSNKQAFCGCMAERVNALSDDAIASNAIAARKNYEARVQARREGKPDPGRSLSLMDEIQAACKQVAK